MFTDDDRRHMYEVFEASVGARAASLLMAHLPPAGWADLATRQHVEMVRTELRGEIAELRSEVAGVRTELRGEMAQLRGEIGSVQGQIVGLRGEIKSEMWKLVGVNVSAVFGAAGLVLATASLLR